MNPLYALHNALAKLWLVLRLWLTCEKYDYVQIAHWPYLGCGLRRHLLDAEIDVRLSTVYLRLVLCGMHVTICWYGLGPRGWRMIDAWMGDVDLPVGERVPESQSGEAGGSSS